MGNNQVVGSIQLASESTFEWSLQNSEKLVEDGFRWRDSPTFRYGDNSWCLQLNPYFEGSTFLCFCLRLDMKGSGYVSQLYAMYLKGKGTVFWKSQVVADTFTRSEGKGFLFVHKKDFVKDLLLLTSGDLFLYVQFDPEDAPASPASTLRSNLRVYQDVHKPREVEKNTSKHPREEEPKVKSRKRKDQGTQTKAAPEPAINSREREALNAWGQLSTDFEKLLSSGEGSDLVLRAGDRDFPVHKAVLVARSPVFRRMLQHDMAETREGVVRLSDCTPDTAEKVLTYLYAGKVPEITEDNVVALHAVADMYDLPPLVSRCRSSMVDLLSADNFCAIFVVALNYADAALVTACKDFFRENKKSVMRTNSWKSFLEENSGVANDLVLECLD